MRPILAFAGPSLPVENRRLSGFDWRPPAAAGDLIALIADPPAKLCLIDGYFDGTAAPWHKEILALMEAGTQVFGAASMGALRAAELDRFGMVGVGSIYRAYRDGCLDGDDEVALIHATERLGWAALTVPMVEIRATLAAACRKRLLSVTAARQIRTAVHAIHFDSRDWPAIERTCADARLAHAATLGSLRRLHVPLKRIDALECLHTAFAWSGEPKPAPSAPRTRFIRELARRKAVEPQLLRMHAKAR
jgi:hypothetical protein